MRIVGKTNVNIITGNKYECGGNISSYKDNPIKTFEYSYVFLLLSFSKFAFIVHEYPHTPASLSIHISWELLSSVHALPIIIEDPAGLRDLRHPQLRGSRAGRGPIVNIRLGYTYNELGAP